MPREKQRWRAEVLVSYVPNGGSQIEMGTHLDTEGRTKADLRMWMLNMVEKHFYWFDKPDPYDLLLEPKDAKCLILTFSIKKVVPHGK